MIFIVMGVPDCDFHGYGGCLTMIFIVEGFRNYDYHRYNYDFHS